MARARDESPAPRDPNFAACVAATPCVVAADGGVLVRERVATALNGAEWSCEGYNSGGGAFDRWPTAIHPQSFPGLSTIVDRGFDHAVSFHGFTRDGIAIGGGALESFRTKSTSSIAIMQGVCLSISVSFL